MRSFALVGLSAALFMTGVTAGPYKRDSTTGISSSAVFSLASASTGVPSPLPTGGQGSGSQIMICHPIDLSTVPAPYPGIPINATSAIPSGSVPTSSLLVPSSSLLVSTPAPSVSISISAPTPTGSQGSGGPAYICQPADPSFIPPANPGTTNTSIASVPVSTSDAPSVSALGSTTGIPLPTSTDIPASVRSIYICYAADPASVSAPFPGTPNNTTLTSTLADPTPTSTVSISIPTQ
ncbi:hypothetical protein M413DRAFT_369529 [Hebeloma cylindrosporum]|uniref:Uncharacterized protein n=1 Tax=Hebeloma cylindrosporum TaxID=76867 RepID=A0A0C3BUN4_HEBCY|nr:hypothetical protein M413DRAFT_369529 [Hebeloma cylindrosporum h7]